MRDQIKEIQEQLNRAESIVPLNRLKYRIDIITRIPEGYKGLIKYQIRDKR